MKKINQVSVFCFLVLLGAPIRSVYAFGKSKPVVAPIPIPVDPVGPINPDPSLELGEIIVNGSGCLKDSNDVSVSEGGLKIHLGLSQFNLSSVNSEFSNLHMACNLAIPFSMKPLKRLVLIRSSLDGFHELSTASSGKLKLMSFLAGQSLAGTVELNIGDTVAPLSGPHSLLNEAKILSECGKSGIMRVGLTGELKSVDADYLNVRNLDVQLAIEDCEQI